MPPQPPLLTATPTSTQTVTSFAHPSVDIPIIKHIPKSARPACSNALSGILNIIPKPNAEISAWTRLFNFGLSMLGKPLRGRKRHNLSSIIKKRAEDCSQGVAGSAENFGDNDAIMMRHREDNRTLLPLSLLLSRPK